MFDLKPNDRARFFHPSTLGTMEWATVLKVINNGCVQVRFDKPSPHTGGRIFRVPVNHIGETT